MPLAGQFVNAACSLRNVLFPPNSGPITITILITIARTLVKVMAMAMVSPSQLSLFVVESI